MFDACHQRVRRKNIYTNKMFTTEGPAPLLIDDSDENLVYTPIQFEKVKGTEAELLFCFWRESDWNNRAP